jgi:hypothetical protein
MIDNKSLKPKSETRNLQSEISLIDFLGVKYSGRRGYECATLNLAVEAAGIALVAGGPTYLVNLEQYCVLVAIQVNGTDLLNVAGSSPF